MRLRNGDYWGDGLGHEALSNLLRDSGVYSRWIGRDGGGVLRALRAGKPVIAHMGKGTFTRSGHYILLCGVTAEGEVIVNDPGSRERTAKAYAIDLILHEAKTQAPFCVCG